MTGRARLNFWVGVGAGAFVTAVMLFSVYYVPRKGLNPFRDGLVFHVLFDRAHGLGAGDPVLLNGLEIGEVRGVEIRALPDAGVRAVVTVEVFDRAAHGPLLRYDSPITVGSKGLLGRRAVDIVAGGSAAELEPEAVVPGTEPFDPMQIAVDLKAAVAELRALLAGEEPGSPNVRRALKDLEATVHNIRQLTERLK